MVVLFMAEKTLVEKVEIEGKMGINQGPFGSYWLSGAGIMVQGVELNSRLQDAGYNMGDRVKYRLTVEPLDAPAEDDDRQS